MCGQCLGQLQRLLVLLDDSMASDLIIASTWLSHSLDGDHCILRLGCVAQVDRMDNKSGSEESDSDSSTSASDEEDTGDTQVPARKRAASNKARAAAMEILQGGTREEQEEGAKPKTGLFSLPFMTRAAERQRLNAQQEAAAVLAQLEAEDEQAAAGSDADDAEPCGWESGSGNAGRMSFGGGPAAQQQVHIHSSSELRSFLLGFFGKHDVIGALPRVRVCLHLSPNKPPTGEECIA